MKLVNNKVNNNLCNIKSLNQYLNHKMIKLNRNSKKVLCNFLTIFLNSLMFICS